MLVVRKKNAKNKVVEYSAHAHITYKPGLLTLSGVDFEVVLTEETILAMRRAMRGVA
jgi:hypothetical protein